MKFILLKIGRLGAVIAVVCGAFFILRKKITNRVDPDSDDRNFVQIIANGIKENSAVFDGLYEGLFQAARNLELFSSEAYEEWCFRANHLDNEIFRTAFDKNFSELDIANERLCRKKMNSLLSCIECAGIIRERENGKAYIADNAMCCAYLTINGGNPEVGKEYTVLKSAWINNSDKVIEYGMVMPTAD